MNENYRKIFEKNVKIKVDNEDKTDRKFMRFYFRSISNDEFDFPFINPTFENHIPKFQEEIFEFQIYRMKLSNTNNL